MNYPDDEMRELIEQEKVRLFSIIVQAETTRRSSDEVAENLERYFKEVEWRYGKEVKDRIAHEIGMDDDRTWHLVDVRNVEFRRPSGSFAEYAHKEKEMSNQSKEPNLPETQATTASPLITTPETHTKAESSSSEKVIAQAIRGEYIYGMLGLILGLASIIGGIILFLRGVTGSTSWTAKFLGLQSQINDAAPGAVLFIVGLFMVRITKPKVKLSDLKG